MHEPRLPDRSQVIGGRLIKVFVEAHGREPPASRNLKRLPAPRPRQVAAGETMTADDERLPPAWGCGWRYREEAGCALLSCRRNSPCECEWPDDLYQIINYHLTHNYRAYLAGFPTTKSDI